jgi:hypothetical protein
MLEREYLAVGFNQSDLQNTSKKKGARGEMMVEKS